MAPQASQTFRRVKNPNGACVSTVSRTLIEQDGLTLQRHSTAAAWSAAVNDWRLPAAERAKAYAKTLTIHEKIAQLFVADWRMAKYPRRRPERPPKLKTRFTMKPAWLDEDRMRCRDHLWQTASDRHDPDAQRKFLPPCHSARQRHPRPTWADWINQVNAVCEECDHFIPMSATSNSRNENGELVYGMNDAFGVWPPGPARWALRPLSRVPAELILLTSLPIPSGANGMRAACARATCTWPTRSPTRAGSATYGTFGEDPTLISEIMRHLIPGIQGKPDGVAKDGRGRNNQAFPRAAARVKTVLTRITQPASGTCTPPKAAWKSTTCRRSRPQWTARPPRLCLIIRSLRPGRAPPRKTLPAM